jgi:hypothetical protein
MNHYTLNELQKINTVKGLRVWKKWYDSMAHAMLIFGAFLALIMLYFVVSGAGGQSVPALLLVGGCVAGMLLAGLFIKNQSAKIISDFETGNFETFTSVLLDKHKGKNGYLFFNVADCKTRLVCPERGQFETAFSGMEVVVVKFPRQIAFTFGFLASKLDRTY